MNTDARIKKLEAETASLRAEVVVSRARLNARRTATPLPAMIAPSSLWPLRVLNRRSQHVML
jgi:hypothetical protein